MVNQELIHLEEREGFTIHCYAQEEDISPEGHFASGDDAADAEIIRKIANADLAWFCAHVTASKEGIVLGSDYLGACCYKSTQDFITSNDYYADMVEEVIQQAKTTLKKLCAA